MHRWLQSLIVCLLALALPGQGVAAATMIHCAQAHQRLQSAAGHPHAQASAGHGHAAPHTHSSHTHAAAHTRDPAHTHDAAQAHDAVHTHDAAQANPADHGVSSDFDSAQCGSRRRGRPVRMQRLCIVLLRRRPVERPAAGSSARCGRDGLRHGRARRRRVCHRRTRPTSPNRSCVAGGLAACADTRRPARTWLCRAACAAREHPDP